MAKGKKQKPPENETKHERFLRIGRKRTIRAIGAIASLGKLSGASYEYDAKEVKGIKDTLTVALDRAIDRLSGSTETQQELPF